MFGVTASLPVKGQFLSCPCECSHCEEFNQAAKISNLISFCAFSCKEKSVSQNVQCDLSEGKMKSQTAEQYK